MLEGPGKLGPPCDFRGEIMGRRAYFVVAAISAAGLLAMTAPAASANPHPLSVRTHKCDAIDAPAAMNPIPASADCGIDLTASTSSRAAAGPVPPTTTISSTPIAFDTTDGDILTITKVSGAATGEIAIGGNFAHVITPGGTVYAAKNFAVFSESTGAVLYAGNANSYVRAISSRAGTIYVGGDFTTFGGASRARLAALSPSFAVTSWAPSSAKAIRAISADATGVYYGGDLGGLHKVSLSGAAIWLKFIGGGGIHATLLYNGALYAGGLFETYDGVTQHGLVKVAPATGALITAFNAHLRADTGVGTYGQYDGEELIALTVGVTSATLVLGSAGHSPPHLSSNEARIVNATTGATSWKTPTIGDGQAVGLVGDTVVVGYHRNGANTTIPYPYFCTQLEASNGVLTTWDPMITGNQGNADGGNNGVQAIYSDPSTKTIFIAGAFTKYNNTSTHKSLIAFTWS